MVNSMTEITFQTFIQHAFLYNHVQIVNRAIKCNATGQMELHSKSYCKALVTWTETCSETTVCANLKYNSLIIYIFMPNEQKELNTE